MKGKADLAASVLARLLNKSKATGDDYQTLLTSYCFERFLYRLGVSPLRNRFVLKGAMLLRLWSDQPYRATRDLDLLRRGDGSFDAIREDLRSITSTPVPPDGVLFGGERIRIEAIRAEDEYAGTRAVIQARCGAARIPLQIDMGLGDQVWPPPRRCAYPTLLDLPIPEVLVYPRKPWLRKSWKLSSCSAIATAASRTSSISITLRANSSSIERRSRRPYAALSIGDTRRFPKVLQSG